MTLARKPRSRYALRPMPKPKPASKRAKPIPRPRIRRKPPAKNPAVRPLRTSGDRDEQTYLTLFAEIEQAAGPRVRLLAERAAARATESFVRKLGHHMSSRVSAVDRPLRLLAPELEKGAIDSAAIRAAVSESMAGIGQMWELMTRAREAVLSQRSHFAFERLAPAVSEACARVTSLLAGSEAQPTFVIDVSERLAFHLDYAMLVDGLTEVIKNAAEAYLPSGVPREVFISARARGRDRSEIEIVVADRGRGMDPDSLAHFFVPFATSRREASGVGTLVARSRLEDIHGAALTVESSRGVGTRVTIVLPAKQATVQLARRLTIEELFERGHVPPESKPAPRKPARARKR